MSIENGGHAACAGVAVSVGLAVYVGIGPAVYVGAGKVDTFVGDAKVTAEAVGVTVFSGNELQAAIDTVNKINLSNLNGIFVISISMLVRGAKLMKGSEPPSASDDAPADPAVKAR